MPPAVAATDPTDPDSTIADDAVDANTSSALPTAPKPTAAVDLSGSGGDPNIDVTRFDVDDIDWTELSRGVDAGWLAVPRDYADPDGPTIDLYVVRHRATGDPADYIGPLLTNPGGPGSPGVEWAQYADFIFPTELVERFDIVAWDPRGTGESELAIDCIDDYDEWMSGFDITPETEEERQAVIDSGVWFAERCLELNGEIMPFIGTNNSARDIDSLRRALGVAQITWFGFSYGSELGGVWATLFPSTVRAAILDGATDPESDPDESWRQQAAGFEGTLAIFLDQCSADPGCAFHSDGDAAAAFDQLFAKIDAKPLPTRDGRPHLDLNLAGYGVTMAMYSDSSWPDLARALAAAQDGEGAALLDLADGYFGRNPDGSYSNLLEAFVSITCMDSAERNTQEEADALALEIATEIAPRFSPGTVGDTSCNSFPEVTDPRIPITGIGAGPIVVCGATGDASTPLDSSRAMAASLEEGCAGDLRRQPAHLLWVQPVHRHGLHRLPVDLVVPAHGTVAPRRRRSCSTTPMTVASRRRPCRWTSPSTSTRSPPRWSA